MSPSIQAPHIFHSHATFAQFLSSDPELLIFRRFTKLNSRALLYMQSELISFQAQLSDYDEEDIRDGSIDTMLSSKCWETLVLQAKRGSPREVERLELIRKIQDLTHRYNKMLVAQTQVQHIPAPKRRVWEVFSTWFQKYKPFAGPSQHLLRQKDEANFVAVGGSSEHDVLTRMVEYVTGRIIAWKRGRSNSHAAPTYYRQQTVTRMITIISIVGATLLLEAAIVALYLVTNDHIRFGLIAVFIALFGATISLFSTARRAEMFAATAAYAAVLVVFVSGNLNSGGTKT